MMKHVTRQMVTGIINSLPEASFDTHKVERRLLRLHTVAFAEELLEFRNADDPLMRCSAELSKWIGREFGADLMKSTRNKVMSLHLGGDECANQEWTKRHPEIAII